MRNNKHLILVVDDEIDLCELMSDRLEMEGYETLTAGNGTEAIKKIKEVPEVDLIITDVRMPHGDGIFLLNKVKDFAPSKPVIVITGFSDRTEPELSALGAYATVAKPIDYENLLNIISESL